MNTDIFFWTIVGLMILMVVGIVILSILVFGVLSGRGSKQPLENEGAALVSKVEIKLQSRNFGDIHVKLTKAFERVTVGEKVEVICRVEDQAGIQVERKCYQTNTQSGQMPLGTIEEIARDLIIKLELIEPNSIEEWL